MKKLLIAVFCCTAVFSHAQTFTWTGYSPIPDLQTDTIPVEVSGLPSTISNSFGISKICFDISHSYKANLIMSIMSPDGRVLTLVENKGGSNDLFLGTCLGMDGIPFAASAPPYTGTFLPVGDISTLNDGQNPNGTWKFIVRDIVVSDTGSVHNVSITFSNNPPQGSGVGNVGNLGPAGPFVWPGLVCPDNVSGCELLPDMTASAKELFSYHHEYDGYITISNATPNIGYGPLEIYAIDSCYCNGVPSPCNATCPNGAQLQRVIRQRIYRKIPGTDTLGFYDRNAGAMTFHPAHGHLHVDNWANMTLRKATSDPDPRNWPIIGTSVKQSFCLINLGSCANNPGECVDNNGAPVYTTPNNGFGYQSGCGFNQGIYPGNYDVYSESLNDPLILDNVCNGDYYIVSITDPNNVFLESDETNNVVAVPITLIHQTTTPVINANSPYLCRGGGAITLSAGTASSYLWSTGDTSQTINVSDTGTFTVSTPCGISAPFTVSYMDENAAPSVSLAITAGSLPACYNSQLTFKATPVYGGSSPTYQWKVDGVNVGTNSDTYVHTATTNGVKVSCDVTSSINCFAATPALSDKVTVLVSPTDSFEAVVNQTKGYNPFCLGDTVTFTAQARPGMNPSYQWKVDGIDAGTNSPEFTSSTLQPGQMVTCTITAVPYCGRSGTVGINAGVNAYQTTSAAAYPTWYGNGRAQYLIQAAEMQAMGIAPGGLTSLSFVLNGAIGSPATLNGYTIKLAQVPNTNLTTTMINVPFTTVFGPVDYTPVPGDTNRHDFNSAFMWDGTSNLLVDICFASGVTGNGSYQNQISNTAFPSGAIYQADNIVNNACGQPTGSRTIFQRPLMIFANSSPKSVTSDPVKMEKLEPVYHFIGNGNWKVAGNWENNKMPPEHVLHCAEIIIDPAGNGECILNTIQVVNPGARITVVAGKKFIVQGDVLIQQ